MLAKGDRVKSRDDPKCKGTIVDITTNSGMYWSIHEYAIKWDNYEKIMYYFEGDIAKIAESKGSCTCGAEKTYAPNPPPGHAFHCDSNKIVEEPIE